MSVYFVSCSSSADGGNEGCMIGWGVERYAYHGVVLGSGYGGVK